MVKPSMLDENREQGRRAPCRRRAAWRTQTPVARGQFRRAPYPNSTPTPSDTKPDRCPAGQSGTSPRPSRWPPPSRRDSQPEIPARSVIVSACRRAKRLTARSAIRSSAFSMPQDRRIMLSGMPNLRPLFRRELVVAHHQRLLDQRFDAAQARRDPRNAHRVDDVGRLPASRRPSPGT